MHQCSSRTAPATPCPQTTPCPLLCSYPSCCPPAKSSKAPTQSAQECCQTQNLGRVCTEQVWMWRKRCPKLCSEVKPETWVPRVCLGPPRGAGPMGAKAEYCDLPPLPAPPPPRSVLFSGISGVIVCPGVVTGRGSLGQRRPLKPEGGACFSSSEGGIPGVNP